MITLAFCFLAAAAGVLWLAYRDGALRAALTGMGIALVYCALIFGAVTGWLP